MITDVKRLLEAATPLPWEVRDAINERGRVEAVLVAAPTKARQDGIVADTGEFPDRQAKPDARLIEYAVNRLPDYEAAVDALSELLDWAEGNEGQGCEWCLFSEGHDSGCIVGEGAAALARLRGAVPVDDLSRERAP